MAESVSSVSDRRKVLFFIGGYLPLNLVDRGINESLCHIHLPPAIREMFDAAQRANLTVYAFDPNGLTTGVPARMLRFLDEFGGQRSAHNTQTLLAATDETGGRTIYNTNVHEERVVEVFEETQSYYLLGFEPSAGAEPGSFRNVTVRANRPDVDHGRVRYTPRPAPARRLPCARGGSWLVNGSHRLGPRHGHSAGRRSRAVDGIAP